MNTKLYLALSLLANAVLGFYAFRPATPVVAPAAAPAPAAATPGKPAAAQPRTATQKVTNMVTRKFNWEAVLKPRLGSLHLMCGGVTDVTGRFKANL